MMMTKQLLFILPIVAVLSSCSKKNVSTCPDKICTAEFAMATVKFLDADGNGVPVKNYSAVNQRTKDTLEFPPAAHILFDKGTYIVASDNHVKNLSETGDDIKVSGTDSLGTQTKTAIIKVAGGKCACHISKVSGPQTIQFD